MGRTVTLDNQPYSIIGVMPPRTEILEQLSDVFVPFGPWARTQPNDRSWHPGILPIARLKPGVSIAQARTDVGVIADRLAKQYPDSNTNVSSLVDGMQEQVVQNVRLALLVLLGAVGLVLLIACANVANLLLVRATGRRREIAVCAALGARRSTIVRQLLVESVLLSLSGAALGILLAWSAIPLVLRLAGKTLPRSNDVTIDGSVLGLTVVIAFLAGIVFGLAPVRRAWRVNLCEGLAENGRSGGTRAVTHARSMLVISELALAVLLLSGAGLLFRSFERLSQVSPGFTPDHLLVADVVRSPSAYRDRNVRLGFFDNLFERVGTLQGVRAAGGVSFLPVTGTGSALHFNIQNRPPASPREYTITSYRVVSVGYRSALALPSMAGRWIDDGDREDAPAVVVVNSAFAKTYFPNRSPLGEHIQLGATPNGSVPWMEIVGIVSDTRQSLASESATEIYVPYRQADKVLPVFALSLVVRTASDPRLVVADIRDIARDLDRNQPITNIRTMEENIAQSVSEPRFRTILLTVFAAIALALAAVGILAVMAYSVSQRTRELGLRMALGATRAQVLSLVLGDGLKLTLAGVGLGIAGSFVVTGYLSSLLFGVLPHDPITLAGVGIGLIVISLSACYVPARRATLIDPIVALRND
jgi:putative ABC transport system permease protein